MKPVIRVITDNPEIVPLSTYADTGTAFYISGAGTVEALADKSDPNSVIAGGVTNGLVNCAADGLKVSNAIGQTIKVIQYGS